MTGQPAARWGIPLLMVVLLGACSTSAEKMFPLQGAGTMHEVFRQQTASAVQDSLQNSRSALRRPEDFPPATVQAGNHTHPRPRFRRLANPDLLMYVFPHLVGSEAAPVPGYYTVFPLHSRIHYALPGEPLEQD